MTHPTFLIVGAPKAGTTAVARQLNLHPDVFVSDGPGAAKEPHYFSYRGEQQPPWAVQTLEAYLALFAGAEACAARGEKSTWYLYSETAADQIGRLLPDARIVILLRNPVDRAYSSWSFRTQMGGESETFEEALRLEPHRREAGEPWDARYAEAGCYAAQVKRYLDRFGREQVRVWLYEDLRADSGAVLKEILVFIGVDPAFGETERVDVHNATRFPRWTGLSRLRAHPTVRAIGSRLPLGLKQRLATSLDRANQRPRPVLDAELRRDLGERFRPDARRLGELIGRDVESIWFPEHR